MINNLAQNYPLTVEAFTQMEGGLAHLDYIISLQQRWQEIAQAQATPSNDILVYTDDLTECKTNFDLIYCGGVLGLFSATVMAQKGYRVAVFDQRKVGTSHREWNISDQELNSFVKVGLFSHAELETVVARRYEHGIVRFYSHDIPEVAAELKLENVLDVAINLGNLLEMTRHKFEQAGGVSLDYRTLQNVKISQHGQVKAVVETINAEGELERWGSRLVVNALGSISPLSLVLQAGQPFDAVCPTVGTTAAGFKVGQAAQETDKSVGDVLISVAHTQKNRQFIWEGFPGENDEMTVYLFYYDLVKPTLAKEQSLLDLFEAYFELLPTYKTLTADFKHLKPVYGYIPARHHRKQVGSASGRGILSVGDATSPQSALTFCGFGSQVRNLPRLTRLMSFALDHDLLEGQHLQKIGAHQTNLNQVWVFSRFMQAGQTANDVNRMMNMFCATLNELGQDLTRRFFQDHFGWQDYNRLVLTTAWKNPRVFSASLNILGLKGIREWASDYLTFSYDAFLRICYKKFGYLLERYLEKFPALALAWAARREEWQAAGLL